MIYVCSDIHGKYNYFMDILDKINFSDEDFLYIVGDVVDRGEEPIKTLQYIMSKENMTLIIGNHEHMMLQSLLYNNDKQFSVWMLNGGGITLDQFKELKKKDQDAIMVYLLRSPIIIPGVKVNDKKYYLAHASHLSTYEENPLIYVNASKDIIDHVVWSRDYANSNSSILNERYSEIYAKYNDTILVIGHTPTFFTDYGKIENNMPRISRTCKGHLINLDCGCAKNLPLGCLRLNDGKEFYSNLEENIKIKI